MNLRKGSVFVGAALSLALLSSQAQAHWCDDLWNSSYNIVVRPDSDTSPKNVYVQNNMGYQLPNFKLTASGGVTLTAPTTLKVAGTLLPGEKGTWKIASGSPAKIEDITFSVSFGNSSESRCYPTKGANAVMIVKADGTLYPTGTPPGMDNPTAAGGGCIGDMAQARSLEYQAIADFEDVNTGLDKLLNLYCAGRGSFGSTDGVSQTYCKDSSSTSCPTSKPAAGGGSKYDYMHLWAAGELAVRKASLGARTAVLRARLQCGANDGEISFAGYAIFILGYLGNDTTAKTFLQSQVTAGGDMGTISKAALYMMGDTAQKADVQAGLKSSSVFVQAACAGALGIVDKDDATVTSVLIPLVKWTEPDLPMGDGGKGIFPAHILELVAFDRRGWVAKGVGTGAVTFYGETGSGAGGTGSGGATGAGGATSAGGATGAGGNKDASAGSDAKPATGGTSGNGGGSGTGGASATGGSAGTGGKSGPPGSGGTSNPGGAAGSGGAPGSGGEAGTGGTPSVGGSKGSGSGSNAASGGASGSGGGNGGPGGSAGSGGETGGGGSTTSESKSSGCNLGAHAPVMPTFYALALVSLAWIVGRRRRR